MIARTRVSGVVAQGRTDSLVRRLMMDEENEYLWLCLVKQLISKTTRYACVNVWGSRKKGHEMCGWHEVKKVALREENEDGDE